MGRRFYQPPIMVDYRLFRRVFSHFFILFFKKEELSASVLEVVSAILEGLAATVAQAATAVLLGLDPICR